MQMSFVQYALESQSNFYEPPQQQRNTLDAARFERKFTRHPHSSAYHSLFSFITFTEISNAIPHLPHHHHAAVSRSAEQISVEG